MGLNEQASTEFGQWDVFNGKPSFLVDQMQDISYFIQNLKSNIPKLKKYDLHTIDIDINKVQWIASQPDGVVLGFETKPYIHVDGYWCCTFGNVIILDIKAFKGLWNESLEKTA